MNFVIEIVDTHAHKIQNRFDSRNPGLKMALKELAKQIFRNGLNSVLPRSLVLNNVTVHRDQLCINGRAFNLNHNVYMVGFGKAVLGMATALEDVLGKHLQRGLISIPEGAINFANEAENVRVNSKIVAREGAKDNLPDEHALKTSKEIEQLVQTLTESDMLLVLVSGGGSALLPAPVEGISLNDKIATIKLLAANGATIQELNTIRKHLSRLKGGKLASMANCKTVISLILSDIVGDPIDLIASGPTVLDTSTAADCLKIVERYGLSAVLPGNVMAHFVQKGGWENCNSNQSKPSPFCNSNVHNIIVGSNRIAVENCLKSANEKGFASFVLSHELTGNVKDVSKSFTSILLWFLYDVEPQNVQFFENNIIQEAYHTFKNGNCVCLISSGETTVNVTASGKGGRNQELILRTADQFENACKKLNLSITSNEASFCFLSAGTDGQDGPTPAAGAIFTGDLFEKVREERISISEYLDNNGSYDFFSTFDGGASLIVTGLTGTNVMDIQLLLLQKP